MLPTIRKASGGPAWTSRHARRHSSRSRLDTRLTDLPSAGNRILRRRPAPATHRSTSDCALPRCRSRKRGVSCPHIFGYWAVLDGDRLSDARRKRLRLTQPARAEAAMGTPEFERPLEKVEDTLDWLVGQMATVATTCHGRQVRADPAKYAHKPLATRWSPMSTGRSDCR